VSTPMHRHNRVLRGAVAAATVSAIVAFAGCAGETPTSSTSATGTGSSLIVQNADVTKLEFTKNAENTTTEPVIKALAGAECKAQNTALPFEVSSVPQAEIDAQMQLLASQDGLPAMFSAGGNPAEGAKLWKAGAILDLDKATTELGVRDMFSEGAVSTIKKLYGGSLHFLPFQYNIEGFFYNKKLFADNGWTVPQSWDELTALAEKMKAAGITPFAASGEQGWPLTRLISGYLFRSLGSDALQNVADGKAKLTDPDYVKAAAAIADLGAKGYFGANVTSLDYDAATNEFLTGKAGMIYMGSWLLGNINDAKQDKIGADNVGFAKFPAVTGGAGSIDAYPSNVGLPATFGAKTYTQGVADWLKCIAQNYGNEALKQGQITGFKATAKVELPAISETIKTEIDNSKDSVLWFEALFNAKASQISSTNAALLVTGKLTPEEFMKKVQDALDNS
jgi:raffinose/stachyose/melibiose transport system substrate-binding protein